MCRYGNIASTPFLFSRFFSLFALYSFFLSLLKSSYASDMFMCYLGPKNMSADNSIVSIALNAVRSFDLPECQLQMYYCVLSILL